MITINFHKSIRKYTNNQKSFTSDAITYFDLIQNCLSIFPDLLNVFKSYIKYDNKREDFVIIANNKVIDIDFLGFKAKGDIYLCPVIYGGFGGKGGLFAVFLIAIIIATAGTAAPVVGPAGLGIGGTGLGVGATAGLTLVQRLGVSIALNLVLSLFAPSPSSGSSSSPDAGIRRNNDVFDGLINTTTPGTPVYLNYGHTRVPGQLISGIIKTVGHGKTDIIEIGSYFNGSS